LRPSWWKWKTNWPLQNLTCRSAGRFISYCKILQDIVRCGPDVIGLEFQR
jgi:hypothetical protein